MTISATPDQKLELLRRRAATARDKARSAGTTQDRQHYDGMATYWDELIAERLEEMNAARAA